MKKIFTMMVLVSLIVSMDVDARSKRKKESFPDGTEIPVWFNDTVRVNPNTLGKRYVITDYGVMMDSTLVQTDAIQQVIDRVAGEGGGVVVIPHGTFLSGSLFFRQGTHLLLEEGARLKGSDRIRDFKVLTTRIEGQTCKYFAALVNADGVDGFVICGKGTIDGNGLSYWEEFWIRREWNRNCTNKDAQRPRLVYISNSKNVCIQGVNLVNSPYWTTHIYRCERVRYQDLRIMSSTSGVLAPSTDAIDVDGCTDVHVRNCYMSVNDDGVCMKGGKGTWADKDSTNSPVRNVIIEQCTFGLVHGCLTLGSEAYDCRNIILRNCTAENSWNVLMLKMRPDTPQKYEYVRIENMKGKCRNFLNVHRWTQFFKMEVRSDMPVSVCRHITMRGIEMECRNFYNVPAKGQFELSDFSFENIRVKDDAKDMPFHATRIPNTVVKNVMINGKEM